MMPVIALGDAMLGDIDAELTSIGGTDNLSEAAALVAVHFQIIDKLVRGKIGQPCAVQLRDKRIGEVRHTERGADLRETFYGVGNKAEGGFIMNRDGAIRAVLRFVAAESAEHLIN